MPTVRLKRRKLTVSVRTAGPTILATLVLDVLMSMNVEPQEPVERTVSVLTYPGVMCVNVNLDILAILWFTV